MVRVTELSDFSSFFFGLINGSDELSLRLTEEDKKAFRNATTKYQTMTGDMSPGRQLINEVLLTRSVESFDLYLLQLLRLIFLVRTDLVIEEEKLHDEATKADFSSPDEYFLHLAERKLMTLSYKPLSALRQYILAISDLDLFETEALFATVSLATELRNLIAHNDCRVNEIFLKRTANISDVPPVELGYRFAINDELLKKCFHALDDIVFSFDALASTRCTLPTINRFSSVFFRGDFAPATV